MDDNPNGVTDSVEFLCAQLDVRPVWKALNAHPPTPLTIQLVSLAAIVAYSTDIDGAQQDQIGAVLDGHQPPDSLDMHARIVLEMAADLTG